MKKSAEAALFMAAQPLTLEELTKIMGAESFGNSLKIIEDLMDEYSKKQSSIEIIKTSDNRYQMKLKPEYVKKVSHLAIAPDFSKAVLRTLGLIAVKQPIRQSLVVRIIGNKAYGYIAELIERGFIDAKKAGATKVLTVTSRFEEYFGKNVGAIKGSAQAQKTLINS